MMWRASVALAVLGACGGDNESGGPDASGAQAIEVRTHSLGAADTFWQLSLTDATGAGACELAADYHRTAGAGTHQIIANLGPRPTGTFPESAYCPTGTRTITSGCSESFEATDTAAVPYGCAYLRTFSGLGSPLFGAATGGTIRVEGDQISCTFTIDLDFGTKSEMVTFTFTNVASFSPCI